MAKSLDGIKKLSPDDVKKYRKIVLNYIGEKYPAEASEQNNPRRETFSSRMVDGVNSNKVNRFASKERSKPIEASAQTGQTGAADESQEDRLREAIKRQEEERKKIKEEERQYQINIEREEQDRLEREARQKQENIRQEAERISREKAKQKEKERAEEARKIEEKSRLEELKKTERRKADEKVRLENERIKQEREQAEKKLREQRRLIRQEELKKKEIADQAKRQAEDKRRAEGIKRYEERLKLEKLKEEENSRAGENLRLEKIKRRAEIKRVKLEMKMKRQAAREKRKIKRQRAWRRTKKNLKFKFKIFLLKLKKNIIYIASLIIIFLAIIYIVFSLAVLRFKAGSLIGWAANYAPVPAVITSQGIVSYSDYKKIEDENYSSLSLAEKKNYLAQYVILRGLREKYRPSNRLAGYDLAVLYVLDKDFNQVGLSRINKIGELIKNQGGIEELAKYADEYNNGAYYANKTALEKFGATIEELAVGQTSGVIPRINGYYIVERINDKKGQLGLKYLFIGAKTLDQYVHEKLEKTGVFILAN